VLGIKFHNLNLFEGLPKIFTLELVMILTIFFCKINNLLTLEDFPYKCSLYLLDNLTITSQISES